MAKNDMCPQLCDKEITREELYARDDSDLKAADMFHDYILLPNTILSAHPDYSFIVKDDSMVDVGINRGDTVIVNASDVTRDGDILLVTIDDRPTIMTYCEDEEDQRWLVPHNKNMKPVLIHDDDRVMFHGCVKSVLKRAPRLDHLDLARAIQTAKQQMAPPRLLTEEFVLECIRNIAPRVKAARQWFAVYRALVDKKVISMGEFDKFCSLVMKAVPNHKYLPNPADLPRMEVQSFRKPIKHWDSLDAPVTGKRYWQYVDIGRTMISYLEYES